MREIRIWQQLLRSAPDPCKSGFFVAHSIDGSDLKGQTYATAAETQDS